VHHSVPYNCHAPLDIGNECKPQCTPGFLHNCVHQECHTMIKWSSDNNNLPLLLLREVSMITNSIAELCDEGTTITRTTVTITTQHHDGTTYCTSAAEWFPTNSLHLKEVQGIWEYKSEQKMS
jgi:hypothetical protein